MYSCKLCNNSQNNTLYVAKEMMFGIRDEFEYIECSACGCLQIVHIPDNLSDYYPQDYYSFSLPKKDSKLKRFLKHQRGKYTIDKSGFLGRFLVKRWGESQPAIWISQLKLSYDAKILDIGSGAGDNLKELHNLGFTHLTGIDPFISEEISYTDTFKIQKKELLEVIGMYDFIIMNHVLEHLPNQFKTLSKIHSLLKKDAYCMIRIPITGTYAWNTYKTNWVQLDAPRHLFLHTLKSFKLLMDKTGFKIDDTIFDSTEFQFESSERYLQDIPLKRTQQTFSISIEKKEKHKKFAQKLNQTQNGDQACFYIRKK